MASIIRGQWDSAIGRHDGERATVLRPMLVEVTREDSRKIRQGEMYLKRLRGWRTRAIADHYRIEVCHVNNEIRDMPDWMKEDIEREYRHGHQRLA